MTGDTTITEGNLPQRMASLTTLVNAQREEQQGINDRHDARLAQHGADLRETSRKVDVMNGTVAQLSTDVGSILDTLSRNGGRNRNGRFSKRDAGMTVGGGSFIFGIAELIRFLAS